MALKRITGGDDSKGVILIHFFRITPSQIAVDLSLPRRNDVNCDAWDYLCNQQLDSQSRVWTL